MVFLFENTINIVSPCVSVVYLYGKIMKMNKIWICDLQEALSQKLDCSYNNVHAVDNLVW